MFAPVILLSICLSVHCNVLPEEIARSPENNIVQYIQHFRQIITDYITTQYKTTVHDVHNVAIVLDDFFKKLAADLNDVVNNNDKVWEVKKLDDGLPDEKFDEIKKNILQQYPEITDSSANEIIQRLRSNLYETKLRLDKVVTADKEIVSEESSEEIID